MILVPPGVRILLAAQPVDFRKGMDGLQAVDKMPDRSARPNML